MTYKDYINRGFTRTNLDDNVEFNNTGYGGYSLEKKVNDKMAISVHFSELDKPKLYISKNDNSETYHILSITPEIVCDLVSFKNECYESQFAC